jgi:hypothetical protein
LTTSTSSILIVGRPLSDETRQAKKVDGRTAAPELNAHLFFLDDARRGVREQPLPAPPARRRRLEAFHEQRARKLEERGIAAFRLGRVDMKTKFGQQRGCFARP